MAKQLKKKSMDGNEAASYIAYAFTEVSAIFPITPSSPMADHVDKWAAAGVKNIFGKPVNIIEMQSEHGAIGTLQGALEAGSLGSTYTSSQGLLLMIPAMNRLQGLLLPAVQHVAARAVGYAGISILGDHSDVMATRQCGWGQICSSSVQEVMDLGAVAHLSAIAGSLPVQHFFEGFRTSHEISNIDVLDYDDMAKIVDWDAIAKFRARALNPEHPTVRHTVQNDDIFFQAREASNPYYERFPEIVQAQMDKINEITGRNYQLFNYYGDPEADRVVVGMGSNCETLKEVIDYLGERGEKVGMIQVHLFRPFSAKHFLAELPKTVKQISVLDRTKEPGATGEPLYNDIRTVLDEAGMKDIQVLGGRYGLSSKDTIPAHMKAVYDNMKGECKNHFVTGIEDDLTGHSLPIGENIVTADKSTISCKFFGIGSDGTVGANKNSMKIIGDHTDKYVQAYFQYDSKKSGGLTRSHIRFGDNPIRSEYYVTAADFLGCHKQSYVNTYDLIREIREGGTFLLNTHWTGQELIDNLDNRTKRQLAQKHIKFYTINASGIAEEIGLGNRTSTVLQAAFFKLANIIPIDDAAKYMKEAVTAKFSAKGQNIVDMNVASVDRGIADVREVEVDPAWADLKDEPKEVDMSLPHYTRELQNPMNDLVGDDLPTSKFEQYADGIFPTDTAKFDKRGVAEKVPVWDIDKCIGCNRCSLVCPHAAIRPFLFTEEEAKNAPEGCATKQAKGKGFEDYTFRIQVDVLDCQGCASCANVCPVKDKALTMEPLEEQRAEQDNWDYCLTLSKKENPMNKFSSKGSQFEQPLYEFSGACPGCGETPYYKLLTQLFGDRMITAVATGCVQACSLFAPTFPFTVNEKGHGPAASNSLFENNAEFALGMYMSTTNLRNQMKMHAEAALATMADADLKAALEAWLEAFDDDEKTTAVSEAVKEALAKTSEANADIDFLKQNEDQLTKKAIWMYGGDGWAYDIGYGGLDHVLAARPNINVLIVDNELYANTGGQASKGSPQGASVQFAANGKPTPKKDLGMMLATYEYVYVAQVSIGKDPEQVIKAMKEAAAYDGPSVIIAYASCINHGPRAGMGKSIEEEKIAVDCGFWPTYRYNPDNFKEGKNPFTLDSKEPDGTLQEFMMGENRFASLTRTFPERAEVLFKEAEDFVNRRYAKYKRLAED